MRKNAYVDCGKILKIASNGMGIFEIPRLTKEGTPYKSGEKISLQVAIKCSVGDRVVMKKGTKRPYLVIKEALWAAMPASEVEVKDTQMKKTPGMAEVFKRIEALETANEELRAQNEILKKQPQLPGTEGEVDA